MSKSSRKLITIMLMILSFVIASITYTPLVSAQRITNPVVVVIRIDGMIGPGKSCYVEEALSIVESKNAVLIVELNTPGGYLEDGFKIAEAFYRANVPVIGYVVDRWALSAGTLILMSTHIAAMQPGTTIGSLQPVEYNPATGEYKPVNESKIINPIVTKLRVYAEAHDRNITIIEDFVRKNINLDAQEALEYHVIEVIASSVHDLLSKVNGWNVTLYNGETIILNTENAEIIELQPSIRCIILDSLSDPLINGLLMSLGFMILLFSIISGHYYSLPIGLLLLILGLVGSGFNVNIAALFILFIGALLLTIEFVTPGFGVLGVTGIVMLALGFVLLPLGTPGWFVANPEEYYQMVMMTAIGIGLFLGGITAVIVYKVIKVKRKKPQLWVLEGKIGRALDPIGPGRQGFIMVEGEYWLAESNEEIKPNEYVVILGKKGSVLIVRKATSSEVEEHKRK